MSWAYWLAVGIMIATLVCGGCGGELAQETTVADSSLPPGATAVSPSGATSSTPSNSGIVPPPFPINNPASPSGVTGTSGADPAINPGWITELEAMGFTRQAESMQLVDRQLISANASDRLVQLAGKMQILTDCTRLLLSEGRVQEGRRTYQMLTTVAGAFPTDDAAYQAAGARFRSKDIRMGVALARVMVAVVANDDVNELEAAVKDGLNYTSFAGLEQFVPELSQRMSDPRIASRLGALRDASQGNNAAAGRTALGAAPATPVELPSGTLDGAAFNASALGNRPSVVIVAPGNQFPQSTAVMMLGLADDYSGKVNLIVVGESNPAISPLSVLGAMLAQGIGLQMDQEFLSSAGIPAGKPALLFLDRRQRLRRAVIDPKQDAYGLVLEALVAEN